MNSETFKIYRKPIRRTDGCWITSDLYAAAFFVARGSECIGIEPTGQKERYVFVISPRKGFSEDIEGWGSNAPVRVCDFLDGVYHLKSLMRGFGVLEGSREPFANRKIAASGRW
jgi:hypothetical protein